MYQIKSDGGSTISASWLLLVLLFENFSMMFTSKIDVVKIPKDSCLVSGEPLACDTFTTGSSAVYVADETSCKHKIKDTCFVCLKGVLSESVCLKDQGLREKRFFFDIGDIFQDIIAVIMVCPAPSPPDNGEVTCPDGTEIQKTCFYSCYDGYKLQGSDTSTCTNTGVFTDPPRCEEIDCGFLYLPEHAPTMSCSDGFKHGSVCSVLCGHGYAPAPGLRAVCSGDGTWIKTAWKCEDTVKPVFSNCPTKKINTIDRRFRWSVTATDNTGKVTVKQIQGNHPGSLLEYGAHLIKYQASDEVGNMAYCSFLVNVERNDCPHPSSNDTDIQFVCNGLTAQSYCQVSCKSGSIVKGSKYIKCEEDQSQNNTSTWQPVEGVEAYCHKRSCPQLNTPKNGALVCDKNLGGSICQIHCNEDYDVAYSDQRLHTFVCGSDSDAWHPRNTVPDCLELAFPDEYYLPTDFYYYTGDCSDPQALNAIKQQFIDNLNSIGISPCMTDVCSVDDIQVDCGDMMEPTDFNFRRKRSFNQANGVLHVRVRFHVKNTNRTLSPSEAESLFKSLVDKSKNVMSKNNEIRAMVSQTLTSQMSNIAGPEGMNAAPVVVEQVEGSSVTGTLTVACEDGLTQTESGACVPCSVGSYADVTSQTCKSCPINMYQNASAMTSCLECPVHHVTSSTGTASGDDCIEQCGPDTFSPTGLVPCFPCPDGRYQTQYGSTTCQLCPESTVAGQVPQKCLQNAKTSSNNTTLQISNFLLTCESEVCLSF